MLISMRINFNKWFVGKYFGLPSTIFTVSAYIFLFLMCNTIVAQKDRYLQMDFNCGVSTPKQDFSQEFMFAGKGYSIDGGFDYFFNNFGFGFNAGYFSNESSQLFADYITHKYLETPTTTFTQFWNTKYGMLGPIYKISIKRFEIDLFARAGYSQINVPTLLFTKTFFNQTYDVYKFSGSSEDWQFAWSAGGRVLLKLNDWLGVQGKATYLTTSYMSNLNYDNTFRDVADANRSGTLEDSEYFESQRVVNKGTNNLNVLNLNVGLVFQIGRTKAYKPTQMLPEVITIQNEEEISVAPEEEMAVETEPIVMDEVIEEVKQDIVMQDKTDNSIPVVNAEEEKEETDIKETVKEIAVVKPIINEFPPMSLEIPATTYDAPESTYDAEAAEFLYKAGESYFATNDFENALPCFNKLKSDPNHPRAKYMFAMSLSAMGNCAEAKKAFNAFKSVYKGEDARTLEIIFASHIERCKSSGKLVPSTINTNIVENNEAPTYAGKVYKIQFVAIRKPDAAFPNLSDIGQIESEYYPNKSVYRYTLGGYPDLKSTISDVYKVRKMGFRDAFIAVYENGERVNTLYHSK